MPPVEYPDWYENHEYHPGDREDPEQDAEREAIRADLQGVQA